jgi:hypothetical protein
LTIVRRKYKIRNPHVVDITQDVLQTTKQPIYRFRVVSLADANGPQYTVLLDRTGAELDPAEIRRTDGEEYFASQIASALDSAARALAAAPASITISPTENKLVLNQGDTFDEVITVTVPANAAVPKADVYFLADTTASMSGILSAVQVGANSVLAALNGLGLDFAFGVGNYKDFPNDPYAFQHQLSPTAVAADITTAINAWSAAGGSDGPEGQLFAFDQLAEPPGGAIGWRAGSKRIIVWFGDICGHDPICAAISGLGVDITEASATAKLVAENIIVLAISTATPGLDADSTVGATDYAPTCGPPGGAAGQGTRIATATGGQFVTGINPGNIVNTIIALVKTAVATITNVSLVPAGGTAPFVTTITPAGGYGPLAGDTEHRLDFKVRFTGVAPCGEKAQVFTGTLDVVVDGVVVTSKRMAITVPPCPERHIYNVKFVCGSQPESRCGCAAVRPGIYATEINLYNYHDVEVVIEKRFVPVVLAGAAIGREPRVAGPRAEDKIVLPPHTATLDDCCRIAELLFGGPAPSPIPLTIGFLEITSTAELSVMAVYTVSDLASGAVSIDVEQIQDVRV